MNIIFMVRLYFRSREPRWTLQSCRERRKAPFWTPVWRTSRSGGETRTKEGTRGGEDLEAEVERGRKLVEANLKLSHMFGMIDEEE